MSSDLNGIMSAFKCHYRRLFARSPLPSGVGSESSIIGLLPHLTDDDSRLLCDEISLSEVRSAIHALPSSKTPGPEDLLAEFYEAHMDLLSTFLLSLFPF